MSGLLQKAYLVPGQPHIFLGADRNAGWGQAVYQGAFYVETETGTRYWANPAGGGNFTIDQNLASTLPYHHNPGPVVWSPVPSSPTTRP